MSDLRLITILPPQPVQAAQHQPQAGNQSAQTGIASFHAGSVLSGFIINRDIGGNPILRTDSGDITFSSNFFLKIGSEITIRIEHLAGSNSAHILSVNGQPPEVAALRSGLSNSPEVIVSENLRSGNQSTNTPQTTNNSGNISPAPSSPLPIITVTGTIISPLTTPPNSAANTSNILANNTTPQAAQSLPNGSQLSLKIISIAVPPAPTTNTVAATTPLPATVTSAPSSTVIIPTNIPPANIPKPDSTPLANTPINSQSNNSSPAHPSPYAAYTRTSSSITPAVITPPQIATTQATSPSPVTQNTITSPTTNIPPQVGQQINSSVISNNQNGEAVIQTHIGTIRLQAGMQLPVGSQIIFEIGQIQSTETLENAENIIGASNINSAPAPLTQLARSSGALSNIFVLLSGLGSSDALNFINKNIPTIGQSTNNANTQAGQSPHNLLAALLTFTSTLKSGDFRSWLGRGNVKWLENNGHESLLKKAEGEFLSISRQFTDAPEKQWQSLFFPIAIEGELQQVRLFIKRDRKEKEKDGKLSSEEDTRFVLEMDLSQLGEMQMDGFVRRNNESVNFDLIIRSLTPLSQEIQKDIFNIYN
ncbi:MAG: hypothetical protein ABL857_05315, partial [Rickettsiales bacterium]